ncbi:MAG: hypothetical protein WC700_11145 [Gemmatimonadaceae bacterium]|jgi:hypothetical protein
MKKVPDFSKAKGTPAKKAKKAAASTPDTKVQSATKASRVVLAAAMLSMPAVMVPQQAAAQSTVGPPISPTKPTVPPVSFNYAKVEVEYRPIKMAGVFTVLGVGEGHTIFKAADGSMFYLDPRTGDKRSVAVDMFIKIGDIKGESRSTAPTHVGGGGGAGKVNVQDISITSIIGLDATGNAVMRNARNEVFTLDPRTGNKVFIKWPK